MQIQEDESGSDPESSSNESDLTVDNELLYHGRRYDIESNLYYYRARYYDPILGRFLSTDPLGYKDSMNLYQAFNMNGMNFVDPMGENVFKDLWNADWGYFLGKTGKELWNVASLGTLNKVENQTNLGTLRGLFESTGSGIASISNTVTLGLQDEIYFTQMNEGAGLKSILSGTKQAAISITPYEEIKTVLSSDADIGTKLRSVFTGISKTAGIVGMYKTIKTPTNPKPQSLENFQARKWYLKEEAKIHGQVNQKLSWREKAFSASAKRNKVKDTAREIMADQKTANRLRRTDPNKSIPELAKHNYTEYGLVGDKLWQRIYNSAIYSRESVNIKMIIQEIMHILFFEGVTNNGNN